MLTLDPTKSYEPEKIGSTILVPDLPDYSVPYYIRIFVVGNLIEDGKESKKVTAYIDFTLNP